MLKITRTMRVKGCDAAGGGRLSRIPRWARAYLEFVGVCYIGKPACNHVCCRAIQGGRTGTGGLRLSLRAWREGEKQERRKD